MHTKQLLLLISGLLVAAALGWGFRNAGTQAGAVDILTLTYTERNMSAFIVSSTGEEEILDDIKNLGLMNNSQKKMVHNEKVILQKVKELTAQGWQLITVSHGAGFGETTLAAETKYVFTRPAN